jgi:hypothetical protein
MVKVLEVFLVMESESRNASEQSSCRAPGFLVRHRDTRHIRLGQHQGSFSHPRHLPPSADGGHRLLLRHPLHSAIASQPGGGQALSRRVHHRLRLTWLADGYTAKVQAFVQVLLSVANGEPCA